MISTTQMIKKLEGMLGTKDLSDWETTFVESMVERVEQNRITTLSEKQLITLERLHRKHFA